MSPGGRRRSRRLKVERFFGAVVSAAVACRQVNALGRGLWRRAVYFRLSLSFSIRDTFLPGHVNIPRNLLPFRAAFRSTGPVPTSRDSWCCITLPPQHPISFSIKRNSNLIAQSDRLHLGNLLF